MKCDFTARRLNAPLRRVHARVAVAHEAGRTLTHVPMESSVEDAHCVVVAVWQRHTVDHRRCKLHVLLYYLIVFSYF
jgi:hypothetical protein